MIVDLVGAAGLERLPFRAAEAELRSQLAGVHGLVVALHLFERALKEHAGWEIHDLVIRPFAYENPRPGDFARFDYDDLGDERLHLGNVVIVGLPLDPRRNHGRCDPPCPQIEWIRGPRRICHEGQYYDT